MKFKEIKQLAKNNGHAVYFDTHSMIFIGAGSETPIETCLVIWKTSTGFKSAYAGIPPKEDDGRFIRSRIKFGGTEKRIKLKINETIINHTPFIILIKAKPGPQAVFYGAHWIYPGKINSKSTIHGGYIDCTENDYVISEELIFRILRESKRKNLKAPTVQTIPKYYSTEPMTVTIGGEA